MMNVRAGQFSCVSAPLKRGDRCQPCLCQSSGRCWVQGLASNMVMALGPALNAHVEGGQAA